jgi:signal peptidase I
VPSERTQGRRLLEWGAVVAGALVVAYLIQLTSLQAFRIPSDSMLPTLQRGDRVLVNKWSYRVHDLHRGDIVVFTRPPAVTDHSIDDLIKRVVGLPGEAVSIDGGHVLIDGQVLDEPYVAEGATTKPVGTVHCPPSDPCHIESDQVWVMGDNREHSEDSRYFGPIKTSTIVGRAFLRLWPPGRIDAL